MQLLINIPEDYYNEAKIQVELLKQEGFLIESLNTALKIFVANGIPLPKGHGPLIDVNDLLEQIELEDTAENREENVGQTITLEDIDRITPVIEKEEETK